MGRRPRTVGAAGAVRTGTGVGVGAGLALVRACADVWGWQPLTREGDRGKYVWCEPAALLQTA